ncbi:MAG: type II toxin-antitoxin system mRNA interferase toxin, RelE/StbE family [Patescibacteria group bacterium]
MRYFLAKSFEKEFKKLPEKIRARAIKQLQIFVHNPMDPRLYNHALSGPLANHRSIKITGDIRAHYVLVGEEIVRFVAIGPHSKLYK